MTLVEGLRRTFPFLVALIALAFGIWAGLMLTDRFLDAHQCMPEAGRYITGGLGTFASLISLIFGASDAGFLRLGNLYRFVRHGKKEDYRWFFDGVVLALAAFVLSGLLSFSLGAILRECPPLPECKTPFKVCDGNRTERDCWLCRVQAELPVVKAAIDRLHLERVGAFPLLFQNARTADNRLSHHGVQLAPGQLVSWRRHLFEPPPWPDAAVKDVAYCVVGYSSTATFNGKSDEDSNNLNVEAAGCRADNVAKELVSVLAESAPQVASCRWSCYDAMTRPYLRPGAHGHLATPDKHLISRSAFVHGFPLAEARKAQEGGFDVGEACGELVRKKLGLESGTLSCSTFDEEAADSNGCPLPPNPEEEDG